MLTVSSIVYLEFLIVKFFTKILHRLLKQEDLFVIGIFLLFYYNKRLEYYLHFL